MELLPLKNQPIMALPHEHKELIESLPCEGHGNIHFRNFQGFWIPELLLPGIISMKHKFKSPPTDILLATLPKSGTTWAKALLFAAINRVQHPPCSPHHPLLTTNPNECVTFLENIFNGIEPNVDDHPNPRLLSTHLPFSLLPESVTSSNTRLVYIYRDPRDTLVSYYHFLSKNFGSVPMSFDKVFEWFCEGMMAYGPLWDHRLDYWQESVRRPGRVLFLRYEEMMEDPVGSLRRMAEFVGCPFEEEEEEADGVVEEMVRMCSFKEMSGLDVNKTGETLGIVPFKNSSYFRKGEVGDWVRYMTPEMGERVDQIAEQKLQAFLPAATPRLGG